MSEIAGSYIIELIPIIDTKTLTKELKKSYAIQRAMINKEITNRNRIINDDITVSNKKRLLSTYNNTMKDDKKDDNKEEPKGLISAINKLSKQINKFGKESGLKKLLMLTFSRVLTRSPDKALNNIQSTGNTAKELMNLSRTSGMDTNVVLGRVQTMIEAGIDKDKAIDYLYNIISKTGGLEVFDTFMDESKKMKGGKAKIIVSKRESQILGFDLKDYDKLINSKDYDPNRVATQKEVDDVMKNDKVQDVINRGSLKDFNNSMHDLAKSGKSINELTKNINSFYETLDMKRVQLIQNLNTDIMTYRLRTIAMNAFDDSINITTQAVIDFGKALADNTPSQDDIVNSKAIKDKFKDIREKQNDQLKALGLKGFVNPLEPILGAEVKTPTTIK